MNKERLEYSWKFNIFRWVTVKILSVIVVVVIVNCSSLATTVNVNAQVESANVLQSPLYTEDDKATFVNGIIPARAVTFSGHGITKGANYTDSGEGLIIPRGISGVIDSKGQGAMVTTSGGKASFTFHEIGHSDSNRTITATGAAFFDANATGNVIAVYKDQIYKDGTDKVIAWKWK
jgi:hypothetical protein